MFLKLSYEALAERLSISRNAARVLVQREGWNRETGNDGRVLAVIPEEDLRVHEERRSRRAYAPPHAEDGAHDAVRPERAEAGESALVAELRRALARAEADIDHERAQRQADRDTHRAALERLGMLAEALVAERRSSADSGEVMALRQELEETRNALEGALAATEEARQHAAAQTDHADSLSLEVIKLQMSLDGLRLDRQAETEDYERLKAERGRMNAELKALRAHLEALRRRPWWRRWQRG